MERFRRLAFILGLTLLPPLAAHAGTASEAADSTDVPSVAKRGSFLSRLVKSFTAYDSAYVEQNRYNLQFMLLGEKRISYSRLQSEDEQGRFQALNFAPGSPWKAGPYVGYSVLFLGYTFNFGAGSDYFERNNVALSLYTRFFGLDYYYEGGATTYTLSHVEGFGAEADRRATGTRFRGLNTTMQSLDGYYIFNNKRFSYPAAYSQSTQQRRSCGSLILGLSYSRSRFGFDYTQLPSYLLRDASGNDLLMDGMKVSQVDYRKYSLSLGYAYNWVFARNCLANLTVSPTLGYNLAKDERFSTLRQVYNLDAMHFDLISRMSVVWNTGKCFVGASNIFHTYSYSKPSFSLHNAFFNINFYAGVNLWRK